MSCSVCAGYSSHNCPCCGEDRMTSCPDCNGTGLAPYMAFDIIDRKFVEVTELAWLILPADEDEAEEHTMRYCKADIQACRTCGGVGEIPRYR